MKPSKLTSPWKCLQHRPQTRPQRTAFAQSSEAEEQSAVIVISKLPLLSNLIAFVLFHLLF